MSEEKKKRLKEYPKNYHVAKKLKKLDFFMDLIMYVMFF